MVQVEGRTLFYFFCEQYVINHFGFSSTVDLLVMNMKIPLCAKQKQGGTSKPLVEVKVSEHIVRPQCSRWRTLIFAPNAPPDAELSFLNAKNKTKTISLLVETLADF